MMVGLGNCSGFVLPTEICKVGARIELLTAIERTLEK